MPTKAFSLGALLSITTGRLLCPMPEVYAILNHMTGDELYTHQLPRAMRECAPWLLRWFPWLPTVDTAHLDSLIQRDGPEEGCQAYLRFLRAFGVVGEYAVMQIPREAHAVRDPIEELVDMVGPDRVIVVHPHSEDPGHATP